jgi:hypothetical protein
MANPKRDPVREDRLPNEARVDASGPEEQALGWYYYLENKIRFPLQAKCIRAQAVSPLLKGETVEVRRLAPEDACSTDMLVQIPWHGRTMAVPLSQLGGVEVDASTAEALADWRYGVAQGYCF